MHFLLVTASAQNVFAQGETPEFDTSLSYYPDLAAPDHLYVIDRKDMDGLDEYIMIITLQGNLAQVKPRIYITHPKSTFIWLDYLKENYGITTEERTDAMALLDQFKDEIDGYILADWNTPSFNTATSMAGIRNGIVVTPGLENKVKDLGLEMILDAREMEPVAVFDDFKDEFNNELLFTADKFIIEMRDYVIAARGMIYHEDDDFEGSYFDEDAVYDWVQKDSPQIGWGGVAKPAEFDLINDATRKGLFVNPANWVKNLSVLGGIKKTSLKQNQEEATIETIETPEEAHYVTFLSSDGDNYSFVLKGLVDEGKFLDSPLAGTFPMNWTIPATMIDMAPSALDALYNQFASENDFFVVGGTGAGYMHPTNYPYLEEHLTYTNEYMGRSNLSYVGILDPNEIGTPEFIEAASVYAAQPHIKGGYYVYPSEENLGRIIFVDNKPFVANRETLGFSMKKADIIDMAERINKHAKNPEDTGAYTLINFGILTHDLEDAKLLVDFLEPHVKVVNMDEFFQQINKNVDLDFEAENDGIDPYASPRVHIPRNNQQIAIPAEFSWLNFTDADHYDLIIYSDDFEVFKNINGIEGTSYTVDGLSGSTRYYWRVRATVGDHVTSWSDTRSFTTLEENTASSSDEINKPYEFALKGNYPNPFNPTTQIEFTIAETSNVTLEVFNIQGQRVATLLDENKSAGVHTASFDASALSTGLYLYRLKAGSYTDVRKMILIK